MKEYSFGKIDSWQHARKLAVWIYKVTANFQMQEKFALISQMRRAAVSVASNLAEGSSRKTFKGQACFSTISYSSTVELLNGLIIAKDLTY
jgi:four helix bundle protein